EAESANGCLSASGRLISVNTSRTEKLPLTGAVGPPAPPALPSRLCRSGTKLADSPRHSAPIFTCKPVSAVGSFTPYLLRSPVTEPEATCSVVVASISSGIDRYFTAACVTPLGCQMFQGTQFGSVPSTNDRQAGSPVFGSVMTSNAFGRLALLK